MYLGLRHTHQVKRSRSRQAETITVDWSSSRSIYTVVQKLSRFLISLVSTNADHFL